MKINYVIATWNGERLRTNMGTNYYETVLKNHIKTLLETKNNITQITIMKPFSGVENDYYNIEDDDRIKIVECKNEYQSYGQWLKAVEIFLDDFDYFIFIEDDYVPATDDFDTKLIKIYEENTYLCSMVSNLDDFYNKSSGKAYVAVVWDGLICVISNGIISKKTIKENLTKTKYNRWFDSFAIRKPADVFNHTNYQIAFSKYFLKHNVKLIDYRRFYKVDFYGISKKENRIIDYSATYPINNEKIFTPIQSIY